jgi:NADH dehydrogenase FAD-containing subunit
MNNDKKPAQTAAAAVVRVLAASPGDSGVEAAAEIIDLAPRDAAREQNPSSRMIGRPR